MPNHEEHCRHSQKLYGERADDIHSWIDDPSKFLGGSHRSERHNPKDVEMAIHVFGSKYSNEIVREIFNDHLSLDAEERNRSRLANQAKYREYDELSDSIPQDTSYYPSPSYSEINWGTGNKIVDISLMLFMTIVVTWAVNFAFGNPIGQWWNNLAYGVILWWHQYYLDVVMIFGLLIVMSIFIIYRKSKHHEYDEPSDPIPKEIANKP